MYFDQGRSLLLALELLRVHSKVDMIKAEALRHDFIVTYCLFGSPIPIFWLLQSKHYRKRLK